MGQVLNLLYQQDLFTVGDVEYGNRARLHLIMPEKDRAKAEAWLTEALS